MSLRRTRNFQFMRRLHNIYLYAVVWTSRRRLVWCTLYQFSFFLSIMLDASVSIEKVLSCGHLLMSSVSLLMCYISRFNRKVMSQLRSIGKERERERELSLPIVKMFTPTLNARACCSWLSSFVRQCMELTVPYRRTDTRCQRAPRACMLWSGLVHSCHC
jgi:hypothetical protein